MPDISLKHATLRLAADANLAKWLKTRPPAPSGMQASVKRFWTPDPVLQTSDLLSGVLTPRRVAQDACCHKI